MRWTAQMNKIFVIAGNDKEALDWMKKDCHQRYRYTTSASLSDYVVCNHISKIQGWRDPHGVFVGTWRKRPAIKEIVIALILATETKNYQLLKIWDELKTADENSI